MDKDKKDKNVVLDDFCIDMLKEVGHICTGNATVALSQVINQRVDLTIPDLKIISTDKILELIKTAHEVLVGINVQLLGNMSGNIVLMFPEKSAFALIDTVSQYRSELGNATEYGVSSLKEIGNIVISAYLATLSTITRTVILHSTPSLICGTMDTLFGIAFSKLTQTKQDLILVETFFNIKEKKISGTFFIIFEPVAVGKILEDAKKLQEKEKH